MLGWFWLSVSINTRSPLFSYVSNSIISFTSFRAVYVLDALYMKSAILSAIDSTTDSFGFMLALGALRDPHSCIVAGTLSHSVLAL